MNKLVIIQLFNQNIYTQSIQQFIFIESNYILDSFIFNFKPTNLILNRRTIIRAEVHYFIFRVLCTDYQTYEEHSTIIEAHLFSIIYCGGTLIHNYRHLSCITRAYILCKSYINLIRIIKRHLIISRITSRVSIFYYPLYLQQLFYPYITLYCIAIMLSSKTNRTSDGDDDLQRPNQTQPQSTTQPQIQIISKSQNVLPIITQRPEQTAEKNPAVPTFEMAPRVSDPQPIGQKTDESSDDDDLFKTTLILRKQPQAT